MKVKFDRVTINVKNLEEAKRFFSELFETTFEDQPEEMLRGDIKLEITPPPDTFVKFRFAVSPIGIELFSSYYPVLVHYTICEARSRKVIAFRSTCSNKKGGLITPL